MKRILMSAALATAMLSPAVATAGPIENACNRSDRSQSTRSLCRCIDAVARTTLTRSEQRRAARFFNDPDEAQRVRVSSRRRDAEFWENYSAFGAEAERACS
tara:strand:+ start:867 stop:1172 length:306 start_codon:yes stop_codon:yes gene_type:complete